jgi:hypothetical protein
MVRRRNLKTMGLLRYAEFQSNLGVSVTAEGPINRESTPAWVFGWTQPPRTPRPDCRIGVTIGSLPRIRGASTAKPSHPIIL